MTAALEPLDCLLAAPFVRGVRRRGGSGEDPALEIRTPEGKFDLILRQTRVPLTGAELGALRADAHRSGPLVLLARHVPRAAAESLIASGVNFADESGNVHLNLGGRYNWTVMGKPAPKRESERRPVTPAVMQVLFQFAAEPESAGWPVRRLEAATGVGKSKIAQARAKLLGEGLLDRVGGRFRLNSSDRLERRLIEGYLQVLRPKLLLGRFRAPEPAPETFLARLRRNPAADTRYAVTGAQAVWILRRNYRAPEAVLFVDTADPRRFRLLPDREGPVTLLRAFGETVFGSRRNGHVLAPQWLVYCELLASADPRAHEAAADLRSGW